MTHLFALSAAAADIMNISLRSRLSAARLTYIDSLHGTSRQQSFIQTECRRSNYCKRNSGSYTSGEAAIRDPGHRNFSRGRFRTGLSSSEETSQP